MELRVLRYFLTVASEESITSAANILHITQPTLSRQLMQLEEELGVQLFIRGKKSITLTEAGKLLRSRAEEIINLTDRTEKEFLEKSGFLSGEIFIGAGETNGMRELAKIIKSFNRQYPQVKYDLHSGNADNIEYLKDELIICSKRISIQNELSNWFENNFNNDNIIATFNLINNAIAIAESEIGYVICLESLVNDTEEICFKEFSPRLETGSVLVWKKNQVFSTATRKFIDEIKKFNNEN